MPQPRWMRLAPALLLRKPWRSEALDPKETATSIKGNSEIEAAILERIKQTRGSSSCDTRSATAVQDSAEQSGRGRDKESKD